MVIVKNGKIIVMENVEKILEIQKIKNEVAKYARTPVSKALAEELEPSSNFEFLTNEFNKLKEFNKYNTEKENEEISNIVDEIKRINSQSLYFIVDFIIKNRFLELEELKKVIKGFKMLKSNDNFIIAHSSNLNSNNNIKIELLKNGGSNVTFNIENFITDVLIELSETIDNIFYRKKRIEEKSILSYETEKVKIKQYEKINNLLNNKEGGSDE